MGRAWGSALAAGEPRDSPQHHREAPAKRGKCGWRLLAVGGWELAVGGPWGLSLRAALNGDMGLIRTPLRQPQVIHYTCQAAPPQQGAAGRGRKALGKKRARATGLRPASATHCPPTTHTRRRRGRGRAPGPQARWRGALSETAAGHPPAPLRSYSGRAPHTRARRGRSHQGHRGACSSQRRGSILMHVPQPPSTLGPLQH